MSNPYRQAGFGSALLFSRVNFIPSSAGGASIPRSSRRRQRRSQALETEITFTNANQPLQRETHENTNTDSHRDTGADGSFYSCVNDSERDDLFTCDEETQYGAKQVPKELRNDLNQLRHGLDVEQKLKHNVV